jgi:hypothetical protein
MVGLIILLLIGFLIGYFGPELYAQLTGVDMQIMGVSFRSTEIRVLLGLGTVFLEFALVLFTMIDRISDTIRETIKPLIRLVPLIAFVATAWNTFVPFFAPLLPQEIAGAAAANQIDIATAVENGSFGKSILLMLGTMLLFVIANRALSAESSEVRALRAELSKYRRALR